MHNLQPLVSIIIPSYNAELYISEAIASALDQTYPNIEVIVVDDGSSDRSIEVIQSFGDRIRFEAISHRGACAARNRGLALSRGEFIQFLDADDALLPHKIETQLPILISGQADLVFCNGYLFGDDRPQRPIKKLLGLPTPIGIDPFIYCLSNGFGTEGPLHRRSLLSQVKGFRENLIGAQEFDLHVRLGAIGANLFKIDDFLFKHRNHDDPKRITKTPKPPGFMIELLLGLLDFIERECPDQFTDKRRSALAGKIFQDSIYAYRNGAEEAAAKGFYQARQMSSSFTYQERWIYKLLASYIEPIALEALLKRVRLVRDNLKMRFHAIA
ncbi:MAG: glycosyltransferase [Leptolyngbyaceae bacterium]|nr:glycosyltransferase [Leptolyngbyaceae bacterium]